MLRVFLRRNLASSESDPGGTRVVRETISHTMETVTANGTILKLSYFFAQAPDEGN